MKQVRNVVAILVLVLLAREALPSDLVEFSTSMDFDEFGAVVESLRLTDTGLADEVAGAVAEFRATGPVGATRRRDLANGLGYLTLEREDDSAFTISVFTSARLKAKLQAAYLRAIAKLGI